jgi:3-methyl-2-oxobutanoate hydroxymethyltransferase
LQDARAIADAGVYSMVLEGVPAPLAARIRAQVPVPIIGIGAGAECDGQVLVCYDLLGLTPERVPRFVKMYDNWYARGVSAFQSYASEVRDGLFPTAAHSFGVAAPAPLLNPTGNVSGEPGKPALEAKTGEPPH